MKKKVIRNNPDGMKPIKKSIEDTEAWQAADFRYSSALVHEMMPFFAQDKMTPVERTAFLEEIIALCEEYYPAVIELGFRKIKEGEDEIARCLLDKGLSSVKAHFDLDILIQAYYKIGDFLEDHLRFHMAIEYYGQLLDIDEDKSGVLERVAACLAFIGDVDKAVDYMKKAMQLDPMNHRHYCNMGWLEMIRGNLDRAKQALEKALELNPKDSFNLNNYKIYKEMIKRGLKDWEAYLLRDVDHERLDQLIDDEEDQEKEIKRYNFSRIEAFKLFLIRNSRYNPMRAHNMLFRVDNTMDLIWDLQSPDPFLYEDIDTVCVLFLPIMDGIILRTQDIDEEQLDDMFSVLVEFYKFLEDRGLVSGYKELGDLIAKERSELICKVNKFKEIRESMEMSDDQKRRMLEKQFHEERRDRHFEA